MPLCRLSIHVEDGDGPRTVDVALPDGISVHALLPTVVDLVGSPHPDTGEPTRWHLGWVSGVPIDLALTLAENNARDGDLLALTAQTPSPPRHGDWDPCQTVSDALGPRPESPVAEMICGCALLAGAITLVWTGLTVDRLVHLAITAVAACVAMALAISRPHRSPLRVVAVALCAAAGFLAVPSGPAAANAFLAAAAAGSAVALLARWTDRWSPSLIAAGCISSIVALASAVPLFAPTPTAAVGALVTTMSIGILAASGRLSAALSGLARPGPLVDVTARATRAHAALSGLVAGGALGAAAGSALVLLAHLHDGTDSPSRVAFTATVAIVLVARVRVHVGSPRRVALTAAGLFCATVALTMTSAASPVLAPWCAAVFIGVGLATVGGLDLGAAAGRAVDVVDYIALTAVIPLACWLGGVYAAARGWHTT